MDPTNILEKLWTVAPVVFVMGLGIWYLVKENASLKLENKELMRTAIETLTKSNQHMDVINDTMKSYPQVMAAIQDKLLAAVKEIRDELIRGGK